MPKLFVSVAEMSARTACLLTTIVFWCAYENFATFGVRSLSRSADIMTQQAFVRTTATLSQARAGLAATSSGELVFFGGGENITGLSDRVDIYNVTSGSWTTATLSVPRAGLAATSSGNLVFFAGGANGLVVTTVFTAVDIYNTTDGSWQTANLSKGRYGMAAVSIGDLVIFAGGGNRSEESQNIVDIYNVTNGNWTYATLSVPRFLLGGTAVQNLAIFAGGYALYNVSNAVDIFNLTSGMWNTSTLSVARYNLVATSLGSLAFFAAGNTSLGQILNIVDIFNSTAQTWSTATLSQARVWLATASIGDIVAFGGGTPDGFTPSAVVDMYSTTSDIWFTTSLSQPRGFIAAASASNKVFFGGGLGNTGLTNVVDIFDFTLQSSPLSIVAPQSPFRNATPSIGNYSALISSTLPPTVIAEMVTGVSLFAIGVGIGIFVALFKRKKSKKEPKRNVYSELSQIRLEEPKNIERDTPIEELRRSQQGLRHSQISFNELTVDRELGEGSYGKVCLGRWNDAPVALKFCRKKTSMDEFMSEVKILLQLPPHPNVIQMFGISIDGPQSVLILEYCSGGSLDKLLFNSGQVLSNERKMDLVRGIARGVYHLHKHNIVHRDLAARNILLNASGEPKITDFGMSRILEKADEGKTNSGVGPVCWMAPESIAQRQYSKKSDVWTFGIVGTMVPHLCKGKGHVH
jgi:predicted Ser/Thr protein kinase